MRGIQHHGVSIRRSLLIVLTFVLAVGYPFAAIAETQEETPPAPSETQSAPEATQSPAPPSEAAKKEPEKPKVEYTYNPETKHWDSNLWQYNPATGTYERPPAPKIIEPEVTEKESAELEKTVDTTVTLENEITSDAASGDALVFKNTTGGNATSGDAAVTANVLNVVNSTVGTAENQKVAQFTQDIMGDVKGDIILSPLLLRAFLEAEAADTYDATVSVNNNFGINNNLLLNAQSGDATVAKNTTAGNATSGNATAVANVVNVLNSMIATQQSFMGTINIYGNLEGDILIAPDFIPQMIANNGGKASDIEVSSQDTQTIVNNISAVAESGAASVFGNSKAGSATSGNADSNVVIFNLSGHEVIAKNSLLVFVNVLGKWVGVIVDAPEGATAAMLSNGVTSSAYAPDLTVNSQSQYGITNTIAVNAASGDAVVAQNTQAGNAVSGSAKAMANIANVTGNQFAASEWFGVLFINVFQNWFGSFGVNTPYGNIPMEPQPESQAPIEFRPASAETAEVRYFDTRSTVARAAAVAAIVSTILTEVEEISTETESLVEFEASSATRGAEDTVIPQTAPEDYRLFIIAGSLLVVGLSVIGLKRLLG